MGVGPLQGRQFRLDAQPLLLQLGNPRLGILLGNHVPDHEVNVALTFAFDLVTLRLQPQALRGGAPRKPLSLAVVAADVGLDQPWVLQLLDHPTEHKSLDVAQVDDPAIRATAILAHS